MTVWIWQTHWPYIFGQLHKFCHFYSSQKILNQTIKIKCRLSAWIQEAWQKHCINCLTVAIFIHSSSFSETPKELCNWLINYFMARQALFTSCYMKSLIIKQKKRFSTLIPRVDLAFSLKYSKSKEILMSVKECMIGLKIQNKPISKI